jgi:hypothetical protein
VVGVHAVRHLLSPGTPTYALLKVGALTSIFGLQYALRRRARGGGAPDERAAPAEPQPARAHPRSKKKKRRRR